MNNRILLIDNDSVFGSSVTTGLEASGYEVHYQTTYSNVIGVINSFNPNILILDCGVGGKSIELASRVKLNNHKLPIIFITSHVETPFMINAIENGGDLFIEKPFNIKVLIAFIEKCINDNSYMIFKFGNSKLDVTTKQVYVNSTSTPQSLSRSEYEMLKLLIVNTNELVDKDMINTALYGDSECNINSITNLICRLRSFISKDSAIKIETLRNIGYKMVVCDC